MNELNDLLKINKDLKSNLVKEIPREQIDEYCDLCTEFVELRTKYIILEKISDGSALEEFYQTELNELNDKRQKMEIEIKQLFNTRLETEETPENFELLIDNGEKLLKELEKKKKNLNSDDFDQYVLLAKDEIKSLLEINNKMIWYQKAYKKLSDFSGVEVFDENHFLLLKKYHLYLRNNQILLDPNEICILDIDINTPLSIIISILIERLTALNDFKNICEKLKLEYEVSKEFPLIFITTKKFSNITFALFGFEDHPLVDCNEIDIDQFNNNSSIPLIEKIKKD